MCVSGKLLAPIPARLVGGCSVHSSVVTVTSGFPHFGQIFLLEFSTFALLCGCSNGKGTNVEKAFAVGSAVCMLARKVCSPQGRLWLLWGLSALELHSSSFFMASSLAKAEFLYYCFASVYPHSPPMPVLLVEPYRGSQHHREKSRIPGKTDRLCLAPSDLLPSRSTDLLVTGDIVPRHSSSAGLCNCHTYPSLDTI